MATNDIRIVGWTRIVPQLSTFFSVLKRRPNQLTPFNLFVSGAPGTNKSEGMQALCRFLSHTVSLVDSSTLDDVSELAGVIDLQANRERGESKLIEGQLLKTEILILDEFLNTRMHVVPQFRLLLQGLLVLMGQKVPMATKAIIGMGNLSEDMLVGQANLLDSPTADRFAMIVTVPSFSEMTPAEQEAILEDLPNGEFVASFEAAVAGIDTQWDSTERELGIYATRYVKSLAGQLAGTPFSFEGRRGKLLRSFVIAALALHRAEPDRDLDVTVWQIVHDCLTYHRLAGLELDINNLKTAHATAFEVLKNIGIEALIADEPTLEGKIALIVSHLNEVSAITKADVFGKVMTNGDWALQIAVQQLVRAPLFAGQPIELKGMIERIQFPFPKDGIRLDGEELVRFSAMSPAEATLYQLCGGDEKWTASKLAEVQAHLARWGLS